MIKVKNIQNGEINEVWYVSMKDGQIIGGSKKPREDFFAKFGQFVSLTGNTEDGFPIYTVNDGFELTAQRTRKPKQPKPAEVEAPVEAPVNDEPEVTPEAPVEAVDEVAPAADIVEGYITDAEAGVSMESIKAELLTKYGSMGADIFEAVCKVAKIQPSTINEQDVEAIFNRMAKREPAKVWEIKRSAGNNGKDYFSRDFDEICDYVADGQPVYMYGAAGCGKSHTAEQIANRLNLDYYTQSQVLFAHDVKGYGDANGNYQNTPFFNAFTKGGLFFIDEMDASAPEALVVLNTAIANRRYDFPIIGCVEAHPNFRIVAAGNTALTGADIEYTARSVQDASTINRFAFFEMHYEKDVELNIMAKGDKELYAFITDLRHAIKEANIQLCVSYRQTAVLATEKAVKYGRDKGLMRNVFGGREKDEIRIIYGQLKKTDNVWAQAMSELIK